jgi:hypothetical protein
VPSQPRYAPVRPNGLRALALADGELQTEPRGRAAAPRLRPHSCASMCPRQLVPSAASGRAGMKAPFRRCGMQHLDLFRG